AALRRNYSWAHLMKRVFAIDVLQCDRCGGVMRIIAAIHPPDTTQKILDCLGLPSRADAERHRLAELLLSDYNEFCKPDISKLERLLTEIHERLLSTARERGWEVDE